jgi:hypothetical protein
VYKDKPKLLDQLSEALRLKHYSLKTEKSYIHWGRRFILFHNKRHPQEMETPETQSFLNHSVQVLFFPNSTKVGGRAPKVCGHPWPQTIRPPSMANGRGSTYFALLTFDLITFPIASPID